MKDAERFRAVPEGVDDNTDIPFGPSLDEAKESSLPPAIQKTHELDGAVRFG